MALRILIIAAMEVEVAPLRRRLGFGPDPRMSGLWTLARPGLQVRLCCTGLGQERLTRGLDAQWDLDRFDHLILPGFSGALHDRVRVGQAFVVDRIVDIVGGCTHTLRASEAAGRAGAVTTAVVTQMLSTARAKRALHEKTGADMVDMESLAAWHWAQTQQVDLDVIRAVSDAVDDSLPEQASQWIDDQGRTRPLAALGWLMRHPARLGMLMALGRRSRLAAEALAVGVMRRLDVLQEAAS